VDNQDILERIKALVEEEHSLRETAEESNEIKAGRIPDPHRLQQLEEQLDQCWDLLRQRRAKKDYGANPDEAQTRPAKQVEDYTS
jgi:hypothetical protein